ncbi:methyltransferase domain-containing protein [Streptomyces sp. NPDC020875]|uniref:methyltransferase domain-containing protein n=1 Tax=Streptomyces sp. NPDC020875 TaxID=3154898 RepID=UPI0033F225F3
MRTHDAQTLVLTVLAEGPLHGYAVNSAVEKLSGERLGSGSLYGALARLERKGLVEPMEVRERRRPYRITGRGRDVLKAEARTMERVSGQVFETAPPDEIHYLDRVAAGAGRSYKHLALCELRASAGHTVVDLGCGPGTDLLSLARAVGPEGTVIGIDASREMVARAGERVAQEAEGQAAGNVEVRLGDVHRLPLPDAGADRARTDRVLQHVEDPAAVLAEVRRVLRPGGRLVTAEPDWDTLAFDHPDLETARAWTRHITDRIVRNGVLGRQLPRLALAAGFDVPTVIPVTSVFRDVRAADDVLGLHRNTERAVDAGYLTREQGRRWLDALASDGPFLAAVTLYVVVADVPPSRL